MSCRIRLLLLHPLVSIIVLIASSTAPCVCAHAQQTAQRLPEQADNSAPEPEETTVRAMTVQWRKLFNEGAWSELEAVANQLRSQRLRLQGGAWALRVFYGTVSPAGPLTSTDAAWEAQIAKLQDWARQEPESPTPHIALANAYVNYAWKARGNGWANTVTPQGWQLLNQRLQLARQSLEQVAKSGSNDPEWYVAMQRVALGQGWTRAEVDNLVDAALNAEPGYFYFARAHANYLLPKWYGKPGETEQFAARVADRIGGLEGDATYFLVAATINCCRRMQAPAMQWDRVRQGYFALEQLYGTNNYERNAFAYLALKAGDAQTAQQAFAKIGDDWSAAVWRSKPRFDASRLGHPMGDVQPLQPDKTDAADTAN